MNLSANYFELFGLPVSFVVDRSVLDRAYRDVQAQVHPDKFAHASDTEQRLAMQWATQVNEAYTSLKTPLRRARYMLELAGVDAALENNTAMPAAFLIEQMEWREAVHEAVQAGSLHDVEELHHRLKNDLAARYERLSSLLDALNSRKKDDPAAEAAGEVRKLMFLDKLLHDIDEQLTSLEDAI